MPNDPSAGSHSTEQRSTQSDGPVRTPADGVPARKEGEPKRVIRMGKYEVVAHIATGGMGAVYRARDSETGRDIALKVLPPEMAAKPAMLERFRREARSAAKLRHENIVTVHDFGEIQGTNFLAMEFIEGTDLHEHVKRNGTFDPEQARQIVLQGARALRVSGAESIVHRDIKPSNFLLTWKNHRPHIKLTDFGLAREVDADEFRVTRAGTTVGTVDYMSPEQARDSSAADIRSDLYSLGATWYHLLVGHAPFPEGGLGERLIKIMQQEPPDPREVNPKVSAETWAVLSRLLSKDPRDRHQTPDELIDDLLALEGKAVAVPKPVRPRVRKKPRRTEAAAVTDDEPAEPGHQLWYILGGLAAAVLIAGGLVFAFRPPRAGPDESVDPPGQARVDPSVVVPPIPTPGVPPTPPVPVPPVPTPPVPVKTLPVVSPASKPADVKALREQAEAPWASAAAVPADALVVQLRRGVAASPTSFRSLAAACQAAPPGKALVIEIHDNGPLFELPVGSVEGRDLVLRAGKGFRPLLIWDLAATLSRQAGRKPTDPLTFLQLRRGRLFLEGIELAWRWPEALAAPGVVFDVEDGDVTLTGCTFSAGGKPAAGCTLVRLGATKPGASCRWTRCHARGAALLALDLDAPAAEVLLDGCLAAGGDQPLLRVRAGERQAPRVRIVRSTLVGGPALLALRSADREKTPALAVLVWDSLLARGPRAGGGDLLAPGDAETRNVEWKAVNSVYVGWTQLLGGSTRLAGDDLSGWHRHWSHVDSDGVSATPWPEQIYNEPAIQAAAVYQPPERLQFAATVAPEQPIGCDLAALPPCRDSWVTLALEPTVHAPEVPADESAPEIPALVDGRFHGQRLELKEGVDLGLELARIQAAYKFGPRVVLQLSGSGDRPTSPIRVKDATLVLHVEEPADKETPRLVLTPSRAAGDGPLIEVAGGSLEMTNVTLRAPDLDSCRLTSLLQVGGGDLRLYRCKLEGPQQKTPDGWEAAVKVQGSGDPAPDRGHVVAINESVILSSQAGLVLTGPGCRLALRQSLVVAGTDALVLLPGATAKDRCGLQASLGNVTVAARRAVVRVGDGAAGVVPSEPMVIQSRECAFLNPFSAVRPPRAGMVVWEGDALARGLLLWQGQRDSFDSRLHFAACSLRDGIPEAKESLPAWKALWGSFGVQEPRELSLAPAFAAGRWGLDRLALKLRDPAGANLDRLGIKPASKRP